MRYSYDPAKRRSNLRKHGLDFDHASTVIESERTVTFEDGRADYGEQRFITLGLLGARVVAIVTTETATHIRVISMRKATRHEQEIFHAYS